MGGRWKRSRTYLSVALDVAMVGALVFAAAVWWSNRGQTVSNRPASIVGHPWPAPVAVTPSSPRPVLALIFRSDCPVCATQRPRWRTMARAADSLGISVIAYTPEPIDSTIHAYFDGDPTIKIAQLARDVLAEARIAQVPTTVLIDAAGTVQMLRVGVFSMTGAELEDAL